MDTYFINEISLLDFKKITDRINPSSFGGEIHHLPISVQELPEKRWRITVTHGYIKYQDGKQAITMTTGTTFEFKPDIFDKHHIDEKQVTFMIDQAVIHSRAILAVECHKVSNKFVLMNQPQRDAYLLSIRNLLDQLKPNQENKKEQDNLN